MERRWIVPLVAVATAALLLVTGCGDESLPCNNVDCSGHGQCLVRDSAASCSCDRGYEPDPRDPLACIPASTDADADAEDDAEGAEDAAEVEASHCGNGIVETALGEECDGDPEICGECGLGTRECDPVTCGWLSCEGDPGRHEVCHDDTANCVDCLSEYSTACECHPPTPCSPAGNCVGVGGSVCIGWSDAACHVVDPAGCSARGWCRYDRQYAQVCEMQCP